MSDVQGPAAGGAGTLFEGQAALVIGATHDVAKHLVRGLAQRGAFVVALDHDETALFDLARAFPDRIEILAFGDSVEERSAELLHAWREEALDFLVLAPSQEETSHRRSVGRALTRFGGLLQRSHGRALCIFDAVDPEAEGAGFAKAEREANAALIREFSDRDGLAVNALSVAPDASRTVAAARAIAMLSPLMGGVTGALMSFAPSRRATAD